MKLYALLVAMVLSCASYGVVTYKCDKDYVVYQMDGYEMSLVKCILDGYADFIESGLREFDTLWRNDKYNIDVPAVLMVFENDEKFLNIICNFSVFKEIFPELCVSNINAVREKFEIRKRDISVEGQNQKFFMYLKEQYELWRKNHITKNMISSRLFDVTGYSVIHEESLYASVYIPDILPLEDLTLPEVFEVKVKH